MMTANLVGFVIGTEGVSYLLAQLVSGWEGSSIMPQRSSVVLNALRLQVSGSCCLHACAYSSLCKSCLSIGKIQYIQSQHVFTHQPREEELRKGIYRRC